MFHRAIQSILLSGTLLLSAASLPSLSAEPIAPTGKARLPKVAEPINYQISVEPYTERGRFYGTETVTLNVLKPIHELVLNAADLKIVDATLQSSAPKAVPMQSKVELAQDVEQAIFALPREVQPGKYRLSLRFEGLLNDKLRGFYRSSFTDKAGKKHWLATTQMEPSDARRMFPCFDEPEYKATFTLTANIAPDVVALSNSPIAQETVDAKTKRKTVRFEETPQMSSYLLALVVGELVPSESVDSAGVPIRVWSTPGHEKLTPYAQGVAAKLLPFFNDYFGVEYPAKKLDLIAIPDFSAGAMENLGAITFRETYLLVDDKEGSTSAKQDIAVTVAHEMAHMWFGDLVTMKWWDDLWLNEAFATWMSHKAVDFLRPDWHEWDTFSTDRLRSMNTDALRSTRSIHFSVTDPSQVEQMFDEITYGKGASVLRMLERYVGEDTFKDGVRRYIKQYQFANATTQDLWNSIGEASNKDIAQMMHNWVYQPGFPLVSVDVSPALNQVIAAQERFLMQKAKVTAFVPLWHVPLSFRSLTAAPTKEDDDETPEKRSADKSSADKASEIQRDLLAEKQNKFKVSGKAPYVVNAGGDGYYRVRYPVHILRTLAGKVASLTVQERAALLSDQFNLAIAGDLPVQEYLGLTASYRNETDPNVISALVYEMSALNILVGERSRSDFALFVRDRLGAMKERLSWSVGKDETDLTKLLRAQVLDAMGTIGEDKTTIGEARTLFNKYLTDSSAVDPDLVDTMIGIVAYNGGPSDYAKIEKLWHSAKTPEREKGALLSLGLFREPELIQKTLSLALSNQVRTQDAPNLVSVIVDSVAGRHPGWNFLMKNWRQVTERITTHQMPHIVGAVTALTTADELSQVKTFFKENPLPEASQRVAKTIEHIEVNVAFRERSGDALSTWLSSNAATEMKNDTKDGVRSSMNTK